MSNYAFIFARGGSKGLPGKNIKPLCGRPLIEYSIDVAKHCPSIEKVFVSTEDTNIANIATQAGAILIPRPKTLAEDTSPEWLAWQHAIQWVEEHYGKFSLFISLPATSPLRSVEDVELSIKTLTASEADACISITPAGRNPFFNMVKLSNDGKVSLMNEEGETINRRQDAPEAFDITTVVYTLPPQFILENTTFFDGKVTAIQVPKERAVDIDDIYDFKFAETLLKAF